MRKENRILRRTGMSMKTVPGAGEKAVIVGEAPNFSRAAIADLPAGCLKLTKAMQKTSETLQIVADLYDDHVGSFSAPDGRPMHVREI